MDYQSLGNQKRSFSLPADVVAVLEKGSAAYFVMNDRVYKVFPEPTISKHGIERLGRLKKRRDWLEQRTAGNDRLTYDVAELSALNWAIKLIGRYYDLQRD